MPIKKLLEKVGKRVRKWKLRMDRERAERAWDRRQRDKQRAREEEEIFEVIYPGDEFDDDEEEEDRDPERYRRNWRIQIPDSACRPENQ